MGGLSCAGFALRLQPVLILQALTPLALLVEFIGTGSDLGSQVERLLGKQWRLVGSRIR